MLAWVSARWQRWIVRKLAARAQGAVLLVGAGALPWLGEGSGLDAVVVVDDDPNLLQTVARQAARIGAVLRRGRVDQLPFSANRFDTVFVVQAFAADTPVAAAWNELAHVIKPEGRLLFFDKKQYLRPQDRFAVVWRRAVPGSPYVAAHCIPAASKN